jgi:predicted aldo/keto reductase-like oxidoreductase
VYEALPKKTYNCTRCGVCVQRCPFSVDVPARMDRALEVFGA